MDTGVKAWIAGMVYCLICIILGYFGIKRKSLVLILQASVFFLFALFCSYYSLFYFIGDK